MQLKILCAMGKEYLYMSFREGVLRNDVIRSTGTVTNRQVQA